jgi:hypothetical protein
MSKAARIILRQNSAKQAASDELAMHAMAIVAKNRHRVDTPASSRRSRAAAETRNADSPQTAGSD